MRVPLYNAFLSYSHSADKERAAALQRALHRFAKPLFRLRAVRVFCDTASLAANPALLPAIEHALAASEYLILMASPAAAASPWVQREIDYWRRNKPAANILIALTAGEIAWDEHARDFDWTRTNSLPSGLSRVFEAEPFWVDFRWAHQSDFGSLAHPHFRDCVADLAAPLHARAKDDLIGEDLRQARRMRGLTIAAIALLASLAVALGWMSVEAERRRKIAAVERDRALKSQSHYLADAARQQVVEGNPEVGVLLALEALPDPARERPYVAEAEAAMHIALEALGVRRIAKLEAPRPLVAPRPVVSSARFSPDGRRVVTVASEDIARIWDANTGAQVATLKGHQEPVWFAAYLPDGSGIITVSVDRTARLWNAATGEQVRVFQGHQGPVMHAAISADGKLLATASADATARLWQIDSGSLMATLRQAGAICCVQISPDASRVATASLEGTARLWNARSGGMLATFKGTPRRFSHSAGQAVLVKFSPDGKLVATSHGDDAVRLWHASDGSPVAVLKGLSAKITDGAFSGDGRLFAMASADGGARLWKIDWRDDEVRISAAGELRPKQQAPGSTERNVLAFGPENSFAATAGEDFLRLWNPMTGGELATRKLETPAESIVMSNDERRFATVHLDSVTVWEAAGSKLTRWRLQGESERIEPADRGPITEVSATAPHFTWTDQRWWEPRVAMTQDGKTATAVTGRGLVLLNAETGRVIARIAAHARVVTRAVFNAAGDRLLTTSNDGSAKIWDARSGALLVTLSGHEKPVTDGAFGPGGDVVATTSEDRTLRLWDTKGGATSVLRGHEAAVRRLAFSRDGRRILTVSDDRTARVWDLTAGRELSALRADQGGFGVASLNASGDRAVTAGSAKDHTVRLWETASGKELHRWESKGTVMGLAFGPGGQTILAWAADGLARLWNAQGRYDLAGAVGFGCAGPGSIEQAYVSDDGERIITVLRNGRTDVWDGRSGAGLLTVHSFPATRGAPPCAVSIPLTDLEVVSVASSPDLRNVLVNGQNGTLVLLAIPGREDAIRRARQLVPRPLTTEERRRFFLVD